MQTCMSYQVIGPDKRSSNFSLLGVRFLGVCNQWSVCEAQLEKSDLRGHFFHRVTNQ